LARYLFILAFALVIAFASFAEADPATPTGPPALASSTPARVLNDGGHAHDHGLAGSWTWFPAFDQAPSFSVSSSRFESPVAPVVRFQTTRPSSRPDAARPPPVR
jgi:hypothetical protein